MINVNDLKGMYDFPVGIVGFEDCKKFRVSDVDSIDGDLIALLTDRVMFVCIDPTLIQTNYNIKINDDIKTILGNKDEKDLIIICMVNVKTQPSLNLAGPIILDMKNKTGTQYCYIGDEYYPTALEFDSSKIKGLQELIDFNMNSRLKNVETAVETVINSIEAKIKL